MSDLLPHLARPAWLLLLPLGGWLLWRLWHRERPTRRLYKISRSKSRWKSIARNIESLRRMISLSTLQSIENPASIGVCAV
jgi:hypothetical protein